MVKALSLCHGLGLQSVVLEILSNWWNYECRQVQTSWNISEWTFSMIRNSQSQSYVNRKTQMEHYQWCITCPEPRRQCFWNSADSSWQRRKIRTLEYPSSSLENYFCVLFSELQESLPTRVQAKSKNKCGPTRYWLASPIELQKLFLPGLAFIYAGAQLASVNFGNVLLQWHL